RLMRSYIVKQLWVDLKACDVEAIAKYTSPDYQSVHQDGSRNREEELELVKNLKLGDYTLTKFVVTENDSMIIVTYFVSVEETIEGKRLSSTPAARLSAWQKTDEGWMWIIHANLKALK
ncbi:nuclear transport factor 2 family protein, partial [Candidatus Dependentiae bacterium]|nr:nuclear transport factor 2 family protein [Candidatus Dependentiae bacterium]